MLNKEFRDTLNRLGECFFILIGIPLGYLWDRFVVKFGWDFMSLFLGVLVALVFVYAAYAGATAFLAEKRDQALEYLFSLPASRTRILFCKILPRLGWLIVLYIILTLLSKAPFFSSTGLWLAFIFFISLFLSLAIESVVIGLLGILMLFGLHQLTWPTFGFIAWKLGLISSLSLFAPGVLQLVSVSILLLPFGVAFWIVFRRLDAKPLRLQMRPYYLIVLPSLLVIISIVLKFYGDYLAVLRKG